jgi:UDP-N-acetylglucosamine 2-epimerase
VGEKRLLELYDIEPGAYYLATVHRPSSTDEPAALAALFEAFGQLDALVLAPLHPRTKAALARYGIVPPANVRAVEPVGYLEMLALEVNARGIFSDSGGVRREAYFLGVPCVTLREDSEWPETLASGWDVLAGTNVEKIVAAALRPRPQSPPPPVFGDGRTASKIVEILERDPPNR